VKLIVGLGNPGRIYESTRHNIGFKVIDHLSQRNNISLHRSSFEAMLGGGIIASEPVMLLKPQTFMNLSGESVRAIARCNHLDARDIVVIHDDIDLSFTRIKIKTRGGSGGHRGVESLISCLGEDRFVRIRLGIGRSQKQINEAEYVLQPFAPEEQKQLDDMIGRAEYCVELVLAHGSETAMNILHKKINTTEIKKD
jgi:PTH1 family peptidyl-tRNA hydrolase